MKRVKVLLVLLLGAGFSAIAASIPTAIAQDDGWSTYIRETQQCEGASTNCAPEIVITL